MAQADLEKYMQDIARHTGETAKYLAEERNARAEKEKEQDDKLTKKSKEIQDTFKTLKTSSENLKIVQEELVKEQERYNKAQKEVKDSVDDVKEAFEQQSIASGSLLKANQDVSNSMSSLLGNISEQIDQGVKTKEEQAALANRIKTLDQDIGNMIGTNQLAREALSGFRDTVVAMNSQGVETVDIMNDQAGEYARLIKFLGDQGLETNNLTDALRAAGNDTQAFDNVIEQTITTLNDHNSALQNSVISTQAVIAANDTTRLEQLRNEEERILKDHNMAHKQASDHVGKFAAALAAGATTFLVKLEQVAAAGLASGFEMGGIGNMADIGAQSVMMGISAEEAQAFAAQNRDVLTSVLGSGENIMRTAGAALDVVEDYGNVVRDTFGVYGAQQLKMVGEGMETLVNMGIPATMSNFEALNQSIENMAKTSNMSADEIYSSFAEMSRDQSFQGLTASIAGGGDMITMLSDSFLHLQSTVGLNATEFMKYRKQLQDERNRSAVDRVVQGAFTRELAGTLGTFSKADQELLERGKAFRESLNASEREKFDELQIRMQKELGQQMSAALAAGDVNRAQELKILMDNAGQQEMFMAREQAGVTDAVAGVQGERLEFAAEPTEELLIATRTINETLRGLAASPLGSAVALGGLIFGAVSSGVVSGMQASKLTDRMTQAIGSFGVANAGLIGGLMKTAGILTILHGGFQGLSAAIDTEGDWLMKTLNGLATGADAATFGLTGWVGEQISAGLAGTQVMESLGVSLGSLSEAFTSIDGAANHLGLMFEGLAEVVGGVFDFFGGKASDYYESTSESGQAMLDWLGDTAMDIFTTPDPTVIQPVVPEEAMPEPTVVMTPEAMIAAVPPAAVSQVDAQQAARQQALEERLAKLSAEQEQFTEEERQDFLRMVALMEEQLAVQTGTKKTLEHIDNKPEPQEKVLGASGPVNSGAQNRKLGTA